MRAHAVLVCLTLGACGGLEPGVEPGFGSVRGGDEVRITGSDLAGHGALVVTFDHAPARAVVVESPRLVRVKAPAAAGPGVVDVALAFADGTTLVLSDAYEYRAASTGVVISPEG